MLTKWGCCRAKYRYRSGGMHNVGALTFRSRELSRSSSFLDRCAWIDASPPACWSPQRARPSATVVCTTRSRPSHTSSSPRASRCAGAHYSHASRTPYPVSSLLCSLRRSSSRDPPSRPRASSSPRSGTLTRSSSSSPRRCTGRPSRKSRPATLSCRSARPRSCGRARTSRSSATARRCTRLTRPLAC